jgi:hypothetical protein
MTDQVNLNGKEPGEKSMEFLIAILIIVAVVLIRKRARMSAIRLQACINNGSVLFDGKVIEIAEGISELSKGKIKREILIYKQWISINPSNFQLCKR